MTPFHVGMRVVCVESDWETWNGESLPVKGEKYTVRSLFSKKGFWSKTEEIHVLLVEVNNPILTYYDGFSECSFEADCFRPAHENRMDELRTLLAPVPSKAKTLSPVTS